MLPPERVQEIAWNGTQQSQCSIGELRELCRGYLANLETQELLQAYFASLGAIEGSAFTVNGREVLAKLHGGPSR